MIVLEKRAKGRLGKPPEERSVEELLESCFAVVDKPVGPTSHQVSAWVRDMLGVGRTGHAGTLDPNVSGVLIMGISRATRLLEYFKQSPKEYVAVMQLHEDVDSERIREVFSEFKGKIYQTPPVRSAVKRRLRVREVYENSIIEIDGRLVLFRVRCEAGTYIRTLCRDIGEALAVGAHMLELRRTATAHFTEKDACTLHQLRDAYEFYMEGDESFIRRLLIPVEAALRFPDVVVKDAAASAVVHGAQLAATGIASLEEGINEGDRVLVKTIRGQAVAVGRALHGAQHIAVMDKGVAVRVEKVLVPAAGFPKLWRTTQAS